MAATLTCRYELAKRATYDIFSGCGVGMALCCAEGPLTVPDLYPSSISISISISIEALMVTLRPRRRGHVLHDWWPRTRGDQ
ncbi:hypothetical protein SALBM135S_05653 [Streptomyces alboniger]